MSLGNATLNLTFFVLPSSLSKFFIRDVAVLRDGVCADFLDFSYGRYRSDKFDVFNVNVVIIAVPTACKTSISAFSLSISFLDLAFSLFNALNDALINWK
jgi:hypothetical protein